MATDGKPKLSGGGRARTVVSAGVVLYINGRPFGRVSAFNWNSNTPKTPKYGVDTLLPTDFVPGPTSITCNVGVYKVSGDGGAQGAGIAGHLEDVPREKYFRAQLIERATGTIVFQADTCTTISQTWNAPSKGLVTGQIVFTALSWSNEIKPQR